MATRAAKLALRGKALSDTGTEIGIVNNADATAITIDSNENVGIGTSSPSDNLHLAESGATSSFIRFSNSNVSNGWSLGAGTNGRFQLTQNTVADRLIVDSSGNVGIGTASPATKLDISRGTDNTGYVTTQDQRSEANLTLRNESETNGTFAGINFYVGGGTGSDWSINNVRTGNYAGDLTFKTRAGGGSTDWRERMKIDNAGIVTKPYQPAFHATLSSAATQNADGPHALTALTAERFDNNADFGLDGYKFVAPVTGRYQFNWTIRMDGLSNSSPHCSVDLSTSNKTYIYQTIHDMRSYDQTPSYTSFTGAALVDMDASDVAYLQSYLNNTQGSIMTSSNWSGYLVC
jgi:hypothetical protein